MIDTNLNNALIIMSYKVIIYILLQILVDCSAKKYNQF